MKQFLLFLSGIFIFIISLSAQPGTLDKSFGLNGKTLVDFRKKLEYCSSIALQNDNKIVAVLHSQNSSNGYGISRFLMNGEIDKSFGKDGLAHLSATDSENYNDPKSLLVQKDNKIIILSSDLSGPVLTSRILIRRFTASGAIDSSFGSYGQVIFSILNFQQAESAVLTKDGKLLIVGTGTNAFILARYNANGIIDSTFGNNGYVLTSFPSSVITEAHDLKIQNDNKIVVAGRTYSNLKSDFTIARYEENGTLDYSFGKDGLVQTAVGNSATGKCIDILASGKILLSGEYYSAWQKADLALVRYNTNGSTDSSFGMNGLRSFDFGTNEKIHSTLLQPDGKIILSGTSFFRIQPDGSLDSSFGVNGIASEYAEGFYGQNKIILQPDNKILVSGSTYTNNQYDCSISRYNNETVLPITFPSFTATKKQNSVLLNWQTASEANNNYFIIERSNVNNNGFKEIGKIFSKGNSTQAQEYSFEDAIPLQALNYYRLKQVDKDGHTTTSKIVLINFSKESIIKFYPNPVKDILNINGLTTDKTTLSIIDINGKVVSKTSTTNTSYNWNIKALPTGSYFLKIEAGKKTTTHRFIKQ